MKPQQALAATAQLLVDGGDERIVPDPRTGRNAYGCTVLPEAGLLSFGSSTASTLSLRGYAAAERLRSRLQSLLPQMSLVQIHSQEAARIGQELCALLQLEQATSIALAASGTDVHRRAVEWVAEQSPGAPLCVVGIAATETGRRIPAVLAPLVARQVTIPLRRADGTPRAAHEVDADFAQAVEQARRAGQRVLLILTDVSKTGLLAPTPACARHLAEQHAGALDVLVDACQLRLASATVRAYLALGFMVALTGSKFMAGPMFSAALLLPPAHRERLLTFNEPPTANMGLLLRWEAALGEMRAFCALPDSRVSAVLDALADQVQQRLAHDAALQALPTPRLERAGLPLEPAAAAASAWDVRPTIFPFLLRAAEGRWLNALQTETVYRRLLEGHGSSAPPCQLGQAVSCGTRDGQPQAALRLCASAAWVVEAAPSAQTLQAALARAEQALDRAVGQAFALSV
jgi:hypothetical protein